MLLDLFEKRSNNTQMDDWQDEAPSWARTSAVLIPKSPGTVRVDEYKPIDLENCSHWSLPLKP